MDWKDLTRIADFADFLGISLGILQVARRQRSYIYVEETRTIKKKARKLCYPPRESELRHVQTAIKNKCLANLPLSDAVQGYRKGRHNINCSEAIAGVAYVAKLDIKDFHPSIRPTLVKRALRRFGVSHEMCRIVTQLVTFKNCVPQGAPTSNHIANLIIDMVVADGVLRFCAARGVIVVNFGDDTAFGGRGPRAGE